MFSSSCHRFSHFKSTINQVQTEAHIVNPFHEITILWVALYKFHSQPKLNKVNFVNSNWLLLLPDLILSVLFKLCEFAMINYYHYLIDRPYWACFIIFNEIVSIHSRAILAKCQTPSRRLAHNSEMAFVIFCFVRGTVRYYLPNFHILKEQIQLGITFYFVL